MRRPPVQRGRARRQGGLSLVELMVSLLIGSVVVGALLVTYLSSAVVALRQQAVARMGDDAQLALALMRREIQVAGTYEPDGLQAGGAAFTAAVSPPRSVFACTGTFQMRTAAAGAATCGSGGAANSHALELSYEASAATAPQSAAGNLVNCVGGTIAAGSLVSSRWFVEAGPSGRNELYCAAPGSASQALVENVQALHLGFGLADGWIATNQASRRPVRYLAASQMTAADWASVVSVRVCVLMRSPHPVLTGEDPASYVDCDGATATSTDRHLLRTYSTTVGIRNRGPY